MANFDVATSTSVPSPAGTEEVYIIGKKRATLLALKTYVNTGQVATSQLTTEQARIAALETSQGTQDTIIGTKAATTYVDTADNARVKIDGSTPFTGPQIGVAATVAGHLVIKSQHDLKADATALAALTTRVTALESRDLEIGNTVRSGTFNGVLGQIEPFRLDTSNAVCTPPATGTLTDGVEFGVILYGSPPGTFTCTIDFQTAGQSLQGRTGVDANVTISTEYAPFTVRWNATLSTWFIVR
jgi:hypothetical protein